MNRMDKYFYFYDLNEVLIDRYPAEIAQRLSELLDTSNFIFIYSEKYNDSLPKKIPEGSLSFYINDLSQKKLENLVNEYPPNSLTTIAQRIPDMWMLTFFNYKNIPTFLVQHGLWSDRLERIPLIPLLLKKFSKFQSYVSHVRAICKMNNIPLISALVDLYKFLLLENINIPDTKTLDRDQLRANKAFIFDDSWNDYYEKKYGYSKNNLIYIGNPDYLLLKNMDLNKKEDAVCYVCQSLVEDGRFSLKEYTEFLKVLDQHVASDRKLYIKLHPRSRVDIYESINKNPNVFITHELPVCQSYIAHYTGMLATVRQISDDVLIWKLNNHHMPQYFFQFASIITDQKSDLDEFVKGTYEKKQNNKNIKVNLDQIKSFDPLKIIVDNMIHFLN